MLIHFKALTIHFRDWGCMMNAKTAEVQFVAVYCGTTKDSKEN